MRKYRSLLIPTLILFVVINTAYFWETALGFWLMPLTIAVFAVYGILFICLLYQIFILIKQKFKDKHRGYATIILFVLLGLIALKPDGLIDVESFDGPDLLTAHRAGIVDYASELKLKKDHTFYLTNTGFGINRFSGRYIIEFDTIKFQNTTTSREGFKYEYATVSPKAILGKDIGETLFLFRSKRDTVPLVMTVTKDDLTMGQ